MRAFRTPLSLILVLALASLCAAQQAAPPQILDRIPAGALGFVATANVRTTAAGVDTYIQQIGLADMSQMMMPQGFLDMLRQSMGLGEGFNPDGGMAAVMLDPQQFGINMVQAIRNMDDPTAEQQKLPFVIYIPGQSIQSVLGAYQMEQAGNFMQVQTPMGPLLAAEMDGYVLLSPLEFALTAVKESTTSITSRLTASERDLAQRGSFVAYANMTVAAPMLQQLMQEQMEGQGEAMRAVTMPAAVLGFYRDLLNQFDSVLIAARFADTGLVFDEVVRYVPDSTLGRAVAAYTAAGMPLLNKVPDLPYVLAVGSQNAPGANIEGVMDMYMSLIATAAGEKFTEEMQNRIRQVAQGLNQQVESMQLVGGGAPEGEGTGLFGVAIVLNVKDADATKELIAQAGTLIEDLIKTFADPDEVEGMAVTYTANAETVGGLNVDSLEIVPPPDKVDESDRESMAQMLGEGRIRLLVASPQSGMVVVTFPGNLPMMQAALAASRDGTDLLAGENVRPAMQHMPQNPVAVFLFNIPNLWRVIQTGAAKMEATQGMPPIEFTAEVPIVAATAVRESSTHSALYIPNALVSDIVNTVKMFTGAGGPPPGAQPHGTEDF